MGIFRLRMERETRTDPVLSRDEIGFDETTRELRGPGDESTAWSALAGVGSVTYARRFAGTVSAEPTSTDVVMSSPPTVSALAVATAIGSPVTWPSITNSGTSRTPSLGHFAFHGGGAAASVTALGTTFPDYQFVANKTITDPVNNNQSAYRVSFLFDGTTLEIMGKGNGALTRIRVDGQLVSATPTTWTSGGTPYWLPITFATRAVRRITIDANLSFAFGGVVTGPNDTILRATVSGPRCVVIGDSFTDGTGSVAGAHTSWAHRLGEALGWPDTWPSGLGGTGYVNPGTGGRVAFGGRAAADVIAYAPDIVVVAGGINDYSFSKATVQAAALSLLQALRAGLPAAPIVVLSPFWRNGVETFPAGLLDARDAIKAAAATVANTYFIDVLEMPLGLTAASTTLAASTIATATSISLPSVLPVRSTIEIGVGTANAERRVVTGVSGGGPYTHTVAALSNAHTSGDVVTQVGSCLWTGTGDIDTAGSGNSVLLVASDGTHPTQVGHDELGTYVARFIAAALPAA